MDLWTCPQCSKEIRTKAAAGAVTCRCGFTDRRPLLHSVPENGKPRLPQARQPQPHKHRKHHTRRDLLHICEVCDKYPCLAYTTCGHRKLVLSGNAECFLDRWPAILRDQITVAITTYLRPESLARCIASVKRYYPDLVVEVEDTGGNLSAGRNRLAAKVKTPYLFLLEDDMELTPGTSIESLLDVVQHNDTLAACSGPLVGDDRGYWAHNFHEMQGTLTHYPSELPVKVTPSGIAYRPCSLICNWGVYRTGFLQEHPWGEDLELAEHREWYWRVRTQAQMASAFSVTINHYRDRPTEEYSEARNRASHYIRLSEKKMGLRLLPSSKPIPPPERPNIIVLTVGHSNSSITTKQIELLGWNASGADEEFTECVSVREVNERYIHTQKFSEVDARRALADLSPPWVIKDPRFNRSLPRWLPLLVPYKPLLLWVTKDMHAVRESYKRRGESAKRVEHWEANCHQWFDAWPWGKLKISAEQIADAVRVFDLERCATNS